MVVDVDDRRRTVEQLQRCGHRGGELAIDHQQFALAVAQDERDAFGIQAMVDCVEHRASQRNAEVGLQHGRRVGREHRDGVARFDASHRQRGRQAMAALARLRPGSRQLAVHHRHAVRMRERRAVEKAQRRERHMICRAAFEAPCIGWRAHAVVSLEVSWKVVNAETGSRSVTSEFSTDEVSA
ncbi:hypothetical protein D3C72_1313440 [compost metagenome]